MSLNRENSHLADPSSTFVVLGAESPEMDTLQEFLEAQGIRYGVAAKKNVEGSLRRLGPDELGDADGFIGYLGAPRTGDTLIVVGCQGAFWKQSDCFSSDVRGFDVANIDALALSFLKH